MASGGHSDYRTPDLKSGLKHSNHGSANIERRGLFERERKPAFSQVAVWVRRALIYGKRKLWLFINSF